RRERTMREPNEGAGSEMRQEERVRSLYAAAYPPAYPSAEPSQELERRLADLAAQHDARAERSPHGWLWPLHWRYAAGATAAAIRLAALAFSVRNYYPPGHSGLSVAGAPPRPHSAPESRSSWSAPGKDHASRSVKHPMLPARDDNPGHLSPFTP